MRFTPSDAVIHNHLGEYQEADIGRGDAAIEETVQRMAQIIDRSSKNPLVREWARCILDGVMVNKKWDEARAMHDFVRDHVRYTRDPSGWEYVQTPPIMLASIKEYLDKKAPKPIGDCDDMTVLSLSLMKSIGFPVMVKTVGYGPQFSHVYGMVYVLGRWVTTDTVRPDKWLGWEAPNAQRIMETQA